MSKNTAGNEIATCSKCGRSYFVVNGHACTASMYPEWFSPTPTPIEQKLDRIVEVLERIAETLEKLCRK